MIKYYRSLKSNRITQQFGQNIPCVKLDENGNPIRPFMVVSGTDNFTCPVGYAKFYPIIELRGHNGIDWACWSGEPVYFNVVSENLEKIKGICYTEIDQDGGKGVDVEFKDNGNLYKIRYWHLKDQLVYDGQEIESGQLIGYADTTGASSGNHLHEGIKPLNKDGSNLFSDNGFTGAVNPATYSGITFYPNIFILDILNLKQQLTLLQQIVKLYQQIISLKGR